MPSPNMMRIYKIDDGTSQSSYPVRDSHINIAYGECATAAANTDKVVAIDTNMGWLLRSSSMVIVHFTYSVPANATLNVNGTGAKSIYQNGQAINGSIILAGDTATFVYDGTNYLLVSIDRLGSEINNKLNNSLKGSANGLAELDSSGKVPANQLPSYVDDVIEYNSVSSFPVTGEDGKIYVAQDSGLTYRWSGSQYVRLDTYDVATQASSGLMSAADKTKLDALFIDPTASDIPIDVINLVNKLKNNVLTISEQTLTTAEKSQVRDNIEAISIKDVPSGMMQGVLDTGTNLNTILNPGTYGLAGGSTYVNCPFPSGKYGVLIVDTYTTDTTKLKIQTIVSNVGGFFRIYTGASWGAWKSITHNGIVAIDGQSGEAPKAISKGQYVCWNDAIYMASSDIASGGALSTSNLSAVADGIANLLYSFFNAVGVATYAISDFTAAFTQMKSASMCITKFASDSTDAPTTGTGIVLIYKSNNNYGAELCMNNVGIWYRRNHNGWKEWIDLNDAVKADAGGYLTSVLSNNNGTVRPRSMYYVGSCAKNATVSLGKLRTGAIVFVSNNTAGLDICFKSSASGFHKGTTNNNFTISAVDDECSITNSGSTVYISVIS